jgi:phosphate transport system substrate-binding protein
MRTIRTLTCCVAACAVVVFGFTAAHADTIRCAGCKTEHFLVDQLKAPYGAATGTKLLPGATGNKKAINLLAAGKLDFAYTCKPHGKLAKKFNLDPTVTADWVTTAIARDPIVVVANPGCGVTDLAHDQLTAIFAGAVTNWSEVGGADLPIRVAYLDETVDSGAVTVFKEVTVGAKMELAAGAVRLASPSQLGHFASREAGAVTFMALNSYEDDFGTVLSIDQVSPTRDDIVAGTYPLAVTYHVVHSSANAAAAEAFLGYLATAEGTALIDEVMVAVPQNTIPVP